MKTGHTDSAGYCLVTSAKRGDMRLISVVMGTKSIKAREDASAALLNYGYTFYETAKVKCRGDDDPEAARVQVRGRRSRRSASGRTSTSPWVAAKPRTSRRTAKVNEPLIAPLRREHSRSAS